MCSNWQSESYSASDARSSHEASKYGIYEKEERFCKICEMLEKILA
jgi:hypothetical protein